MNCSTNCCQSLMEEHKGGEVKIEKDKNMDGNRQADGSNRNNLRPAPPGARPGSIAKSGGNGRAQSRSSLNSFQHVDAKGQTPN